MKDFCNESFNREGKLQRDLMFFVELPYDCPTYDVQPERRLLGDAKAWNESGCCEIVGLPTFLQRCPRHISHPTDCFWPHVPLEFDGGEIVFDMLRTDSSGAIVCKSTVFEQLTRSRAKGLLSTTVKWTDGGRKDGKKPGPDWQAIYARNASCVRPRAVVGHNNLCFACGHGPILCLDCDFVMSTCTKCKTRCAVPLKERTGDDDKRFFFGCVADDRRKGNVIVDARRWDGEDLMRWSDGWIVTRRLLDLFERTHWATMLIRSIDVCVDGITELQRERLQQTQFPT